MFENVIVTVGEYKIDITPILNALYGFVAKVIAAYLPEDVKEIFGE